MNTSLEKNANLITLPEDLVAARHRYYAWVFAMIAILAAANILYNSFAWTKPRIDVPVLNLENSIHEVATKKWMYNYGELLNAGYKKVSVN